MPTMSRKTLRRRRKAHFDWIRLKKFSAQRRQVLVSEDPGEHRAGRDQHHHDGIRQAKSWTKTMP
jgi:hypothetical protein